ncbi:MAG: AIR carboxylase family protein [Parcubacteria group bacterium]|nr:AIR carboxylase family protein [Parcubacteria group bacterium]
MARSSVYVMLIAASPRDAPDLAPTEEVLVEVGVPSQQIVTRFGSAHRSLEYLIAKVREAKDLNAKVIVAGAGGSAALSGVIASHTYIPVIGVALDTGGPQEVAVANMSHLPPEYPVAIITGPHAAYKAGVLTAQILAHCGIPEATEILKGLWRIRDRPIGTLMHQAILLGQSSGFKDYLALPQKQDQASGTPERKTSPT